MLLEADEMMRKGLERMNIDAFAQARRSFDKNWELFKNHYGPVPSVAASVWNDLCTTDIEASKLEPREKNEKGLKYFLMALHFLWVNPKNRQVLASRFEVCDKYSSGSHLWKWVARVAGLRQKVIVWPQETFSDPNGPKFIISVDCRDHKCWEKKHPVFNLDKSFSSKKHGKHAALKYEVALSVHTNQIVWINGPYKATRSDITVFREDGLKELMLACPGKFVICDRGYISSEPDEKMLAYPSSTDTDELKKFKSLARCREEDFNGRSAKWKIMSDEFEYGMEEHQHCYVAVAVLIQYSMNAGYAQFPIVQV